MIEILDFISRRWNSDCNWLNGNCFWFAFILSSRFPELEIYYLPIIGHFVAGNGSDFYDFTGLIDIKETPYLFSKLKSIEPDWYNRIIRDCVS